MAHARIRRHRVWMLLASVFSGLLTGVGLQSASADVTAVSGSAYGASGNARFGQNPSTTFAPIPVVTLPANGSAQSGSAPSITLSLPPPLLTTGAATVQTQGTLGAGGSVTSSASVNTVEFGGSTFDTLSSTCQSTEAGPTGSTTVANGQVAGANGPQPVPSSPPVNTVFNGVVANTPDTYRAVFNEHVVTGNSIVVNAVHFYLDGPTVTGEIIVGQSQCGVTGTATPTTAPGATTTSAPAATTTTVQATTTTAAPTSTTAPTPSTTAAPGTASVSGGAYGYFTSVSLFGGAAVPKGPAPTVTLPSRGSASPVTASAPSAEATYGPATVFSSDRLEVSTQGTTGPGGTVRSSATVQNVNKSGGTVTATAISSTCTASASGQTGSTTVTGGKLILSEGADPDSEADDTAVNVPAQPAPNSVHQGRVESVGDNFRLVLNEQLRSSGSITVNAVHVYLLGPTARGEIVIGQSRCSLTAAAAGSGAAAGGGANRIAATGGESARTTTLALNLIVVGYVLNWWGGRRRVTTARGGEYPPPWR